MIRVLVCSSLRIIAFASAVSYIPAGIALLDRLLAACASMPVGFALASVASSVLLWKGMTGAPRTTCGSRRGRAIRRARFLAIPARGRHACKQEAASPLQDPVEQLSQLVISITFCREME